MAALAARYSDRIGLDNICIWKDCWWLQRFLDEDGFGHEAGDAGLDEAPSLQIAAEPAVLNTVRLGRARLGGAVIVVAEVDDRTFRLADLLPDALDPAFASVDAIFSRWDDLRGVIEGLRAGDASAIDVPEGAFLAPVERPLHLLCIGTNYRDHIAEMCIPVDPDFPYAFLKPVTTIAPPGGPVTLPSVSAMVDWEAELGVVIGRLARNVAPENALGHVAGYLPLNDVSARDWVENRPNLGIDWVMQKGPDGFTPMGPWVTLAGGVGDPQAIPIRCLVNGEVMQDSSTANMLFSVAEIIAHVSRFMTLSPGDVIATGTPAGVGFGRKPRRFIADGDVVTVSLGELGRFSTRFVAETTAETEVGRIAA